ncbi:MAG: hypothetical protein AAF604_08170 [Acidobacteriota bacterium]
MADGLNFTILEFFEQLGSEAGRLDVPWAKFEGETSSRKTFEIVGNPTIYDAATEANLNQAFLLGQFWGVSDSSSQVMINGQALEGLTIPAATGWNSWLTVFSAPVLQQGTNSLEIKASPTLPSNFIIGSIVLQWQEEDAEGGDQEPANDVSNLEEPAGRRR